MSDSPEYPSYPQPPQQPPYAPFPPPPPPPKSGWRWFGIFLGIFLFLGILCCGGCGWFLYYASQDLEGILVEVDCPADVRVGETFDVVIDITNERSEVFLLDSIDVADTYLEGFSVQSLDPVEDSSMHLPFFDMQSFTYLEEIDPGQTFTITLTLRAENTGAYRGDLDICESVRFVTQMLQTVVSDDVPDGE